ncbi:hypothetical protein T265_10002 [Opisthorchis viverrini]|uniref:Uncharacterized protein n=1 Tax=Opisthorchis viverrini TaxID=6198 RepID=A0A074ZEV6_OPIVI|nr:hypothetical protein T265_10002 [Opisthorchis viverrini]KER21765.1 hypothetical protein T265_10002 [Opisthorchis viverrini]
MVIGQATYPEGSDTPKGLQDELPESKEYDVDGYANGLNRDTLPYYASVDVYQRAVERIYTECDQIS